MAVLNLGGVNLTIEVDKFPDGSQVFIGDKVCEFISYTNVDLECEVPYLPQGTYPLQVLIAGKGYADKM